MGTPIRGVRDIHTLSGRVDQVAVPYRAYMRISCLEMERARRDLEMASATRRIAMLAERVQEIEQEKDALLLALGERGGRQAGRPAAPRTPTRRSTGAGSGGDGGFRLKY